MVTVFAYYAEDRCFLFFLKSVFRQSSRACFTSVIIKLVSKDFEAKLLDLTVCLNYF